MCGSVRGSAVLCGSVCTRWCARCALAIGRVQGRVQVVAGRFWCSYAWVSLTPTAPARPRGCVLACVCAGVRLCVRACAGVCAGVCVLIGGVAVCVRGVAVWCRLVAPYLFFSSGGAARCVVCGGGCIHLLHRCVRCVCVLCRWCGGVVWCGRWVGLCVLTFFAWYSRLYLLFAAWYRSLSRSLDRSLYRSLYRYVF